MSQNNVQANSYNNRLYDSREAFTRIFKDLRFRVNLLKYFSAKFYE